MTGNESYSHQNYKSIIIGAVQIAILYIPAFFLTDLLSLKLENKIIALFIIPIFLGVCSFVVIFSTTTKEATFKWLLSIPITIVLWLWIVDVDFSIRALNWVFPDYGEPSAGGNFAGFILLFISSFVDFIFIIVGICISGIIKSPKFNNAILILQKVLCSPVCAGIVVAILVLDIIMPHYVPVYG